MTKIPTRQRVSPAEIDTAPRRRPDWIKVKAPSGETAAWLRDLMRRKSLHTVCEEANCPNMGECWASGTATFLILGDICTRKCGFCDVKRGKPLPLDYEEPERVARPEILLRGEREFRYVPEGPDVAWSDGGIPEQPRVERDLSRLAHRPREPPELEIPEFLPFQGLHPLVPEHPESQICRCMACYLWVHDLAWKMEPR